MLTSFLLMFISLYIAQMGDKTQLLTLFLATKTKKHLMLFCAIMLAYLISEALVVLFGTALKFLIPQTTLHIVSGIIFIILGIILFIDGKKKKNKYKNLRFHHMFFTSMVLIFLADFGDKTQIAITLFAAANNPILVYAAAILALGLDTLIVITFSRIILKKMKENLLEKIGGLIFILIGVLLLFQVF